MLAFLSVIHILISVALIVLVLLQDSKGGAMGILGGGGGANTVFGSSGAGDFLTKATRWVAIIFAVTCVGLAYLTTHKSGSVLDGYVVPQKETQQEPQKESTEEAPSSPSE